MKNRRHIECPGGAPAFPVAALETRKFYLLDETRGSKNRSLSSRSFERQSRSSVSRVPRFYLFLVLQTRDNDTLWMEHGEVPIPLPPSLLTPCDQGFPPPPPVHAHVPLAFASRQFARLDSRESKAERRTRRRWQVGGERRVGATRGPRLRFTLQHLSRTYIPLVLFLFLLFLFLRTAETRMPRESEFMMRT